MTATKPRIAIIVDGSRPLSAYAKRALVAFRRGVQDEYADLARRGIATVATVQGHTIRAVPTRVGTRYTIETGHAGVLSKPAPRRSGR